jgi:hypothetical protein
MIVGTSYSEHRASYLGLDPRATFQRVLDLGLGLIRTSAYWDEIRKNGYGELDWLMQEAQRAGQPMLLTVGMKGIQWPEFYIPSDLSPPAVGADSCVSQDARLCREVVDFVTQTVERYKDHPTLVAWQVENEPFNLSGPQRWWIGPDTVREEIAAVRAIDDRKVVVNAFAHFDLLQDWFDRPHRNLLDLTGLTPEQAALDVLGAADVLGLDVYTRIGIEVLGHEVVRGAGGDWADSARRWLDAAVGAGKEAWIIESQAEPWEPSRDTYADPKTFEPEMMLAMYEKLAAAGFRNILLWGAEYWLWRVDSADSRWLDVAKQVLLTASNQQ